MIAEARKWLTLVAVFAALIFIGLTLAWCAQGRKDEKAAAKTQVETGKALDNVARETEAARQSQTEKQNEISDIPGSDVRLPDGYGARLERVRRGG